MFTGIIEERGIVAESSSLAVTIDCSKVLAGTNEGDSISVNGVCLTVTELSPGSFKAHVMPETSGRSSIQSIKRGGAVNLERAVAAGARMGGHFVSGHVDCTGTVTGIKKSQGETRLRISFPGEFSGLVVEKGSVAIDGASLTVAETGSCSLTVALTPFTLDATTLGTKKTGARVNLEFDMLAKYVIKSLETNNDTRFQSLLEKGGYLDA